MTDRTYSEDEIREAFEVQNALNEAIAALSPPQDDEVARNHYGPACAGSCEGAAYQIEIKRLSARVRTLEAKDYPTEDAYLAVCRANEEKRQRIAELEQAQRWISVEERLPEIDTPVLAMIEHQPEPIIAWMRESSEWAEQCEYAEIHGDAYITTDLDGYKVIEWKPITPPEKP